MRKLRAILAPGALFALLILIASFDLDIGVIAEFAFIWDVTVGILLGAGLAALPALSAHKGRNDKHLAFFWICGFCALILVFVQYMSTVMGLQTEGAAFVPPTNARMRIIEGALLGYCSLVAGREKI